MKNAIQDGVCQGGICYKLIPAIHGKLAGDDDGASVVTVLHYLKESVFAALAWMAMSLGFSWYVSNFENFNKTYGSLGAVVGFMPWIWLSTIVILLGAELNSELEKQRFFATTAAPPQASKQ